MKRSVRPPNHRQGTLGSLSLLATPFSFSFSFSSPLDLLINSQCFDSSALMNGSPACPPVALELMFILLSVRPSVRPPVPPSFCPSPYSSSSSSSSSRPSCDRRFPSLRRRDRRRCRRRHTARSRPRPARMSARARAQFVEIESSADSMFSRVLIRDNTKKWF